MNAATRARWLAELNQALDDARRIAVQLSQTPLLARDAAALGTRIELAIQQVNGMRRRRPVAIRRIVGPKWLGSPYDCVDRRR